MERSDCNSEDHSSAQCFIDIFRLFVMFISILFIQVQLSPWSQLPVTVEDLLFSSVFVLRTSMMSAITEGRIRSNV